MRQGLPGLCSIMWQKYSKISVLSIIKLQKERIFIQWAAQHVLADHMLPQELVYMCMLPDATIYVQSKFIFHSESCDSVWGIFCIVKMCSNVTSATVHWMTTYNSFFQPLRVARTYSSNLPFHQQSILHFSSQPHQTWTCNKAQSHL